MLRCEKCKKYICGDCKLEGELEEEKVCIQCMKSEWTEKRKKRKEKRVTIVPETRREGRKVYLHLITPDPRYSNERGQNGEETFIRKRIEGDTLEGDSMELKE